MKNFEKIISLENINLKGTFIEESLNSKILLLKKEIYVPEKKIILLDSMPEQRSRFLTDINNNKGGFNL